MASHMEPTVTFKDEDNTQVVQCDNLADDIDALNLGRTRRKEDPERPVGSMSASASCKQYNMQHTNRGHAVIFTHMNYSYGGPTPRPCATHDTEICQEAFEALGFQVEKYLDLDKRKFQDTLCRIARLDHSQCDALTVVFMSHGCEENNKEYLWLYDRKIETSELWKAFTADNCPTLAGKPKLFFIQACRGEKVDKGVALKPKRGMSVMTDAKVEDYTIPLHADMLIMWASYPGMFAFKSGRNDMNGSVFLHYLTRVLIRDYIEDDLATLLLTVTREVATHFESSNYMMEKLDRNKQMPYTVSTLMRKIMFNK